MPAFPAIEPLRRSYDFPDFPMEEEAAWPGVPVRYRTGYDPLAAAGMVLRLDYEDLSGAEMQLIRNHWRDQQGGIVDFNLPPIIWQGNTSEIAPALARWRYLAPPEETQKKGNRYDVSIELESLSFLKADPIELLITTVQTIITVGIPAVGGAGAALPTVQTIVTATTPTIITAGGVVEPASIQTIVAGPAPTVASDGGGGIIESPTTATTVTGPVPTVASDGGGGIIESPTTATTVTGPVPTVDSSGTANPPLAATYSQRSVYSSNTAATAAGMTNGSSAEISETVTNFHGDADGAWVEMDFGTQTAFEKVVVGSDFHNVLGLGKFYTEDADIIGSNNRTSWTVIGNTGTFTDGVKTIATAGASYRYVRVRKVDGILAVTELYALAT